MSITPTDRSDPINQPGHTSRPGASGPDGRPTSSGRIRGSTPWIRRRHLAVVVRGSSGQATAEYALVMLAAAGLAGLLLAWATSTDGVARLMDAVLDSLISDAES